MGVKHYCNEELFETWSPSMAYLLGYIYADGDVVDCSYIRTQYFKVTSTDLELITKSKALLESEHKIKTIAPINNNSKTKYILRIGSKKLYKSLVRRGVFQNKSLTMKFPKMPAKFVPHFIRGYFDGDGHISIVYEKGKFKKLILVFVSGSSEFLSQLANHLNSKVGLRINKIYNHTRAYRLAYSTSDSIKIFKYIYKDTCGIRLQRKYKVFKKFFLEYNKWVDNDVLNILNNYGAVVK